jgi:hypothetical protein
LKRTSVQLEKELEQAKANPPEGPEIVVEYSFDEDTNDDPAKPLVLRNVSQRHTAYNVRPLHMQVEKVTAYFAPSLISSIGPLQTVNVKVRIDDKAGPLTRDWFYRLFGSTYNDATASMEELFTEKPFELVVTFENKDGSKRFVTECEILYRQWKKRVTVGRTCIRLVALKEPSHPALQPVAPRSEADTSRIKYLRLEMCNQDDPDTPLYPAVEPYRNRVVLVLINQRDVDIEVSMPVWESEDVHAKIPLPSTLQLEAPYSKRPNDWQWDSHWEKCLTLASQQAFKVTVDFRIPFGDGIDIRLKRGTTGCFIFPLRVQDKLVQERVRI